MTLAVQPPPWVAAALCGQTDPDAFFVDKGGSNRPAKRVCARCPVQPDCLADALAEPDPGGIWGGTSEAERRRMRRESAA